MPTSTWGGCIMDRTSSNYDISNTAPSGTATAFPPRMTTDCLGDHDHASEL